MQEPRDWDEEYLLNLPVGEFDWLEIKGRRGLDLTLNNVNERDVRQNLSKAISAFANSGGGILVLGLSDPQRSWQVDDGGIDLAVKGSSTREWLEDIIPTLVDLPLSSFNVYMVDDSTINNSQIASDRGVFIIEIFDSKQAPHQANDNKYYARVGGKSRPIGHRLVADIFGRRQYPKIQLEFSIEVSTYIERNSFVGISSSPLFGQAKNQDAQTKPKFELVVRARNVGRVFAKYVNSFVYLPKVLVPEHILENHYTEDDLDEIDEVQYVSWAKSNTQRDMIKAEPLGANQYGSSWFDPILPGLSYRWEWDLANSFDRNTMDNLKILWEVHADNSSVQNGSILIKEIEIVRTK